MLLRDIFDVHVNNNIYLSVKKKKTVMGYSWSDDDDIDCWVNSCYVWLWIFIQYDIYTIKKKFF